MHVSVNAPALAKLEPLLQRASDGRLSLPNLRGAVVLDADLKGSLAQPRVRVHLDAKHAGVLRYPSMDVNCDAALDATAGTSRIELRADTAGREPDERAEASAAQVGLRSHTLLESTFRRGADWLTPWLAGSHRVQLEVAQLDFEWLAALLEQPLPVRGSGSATLSAELSDTLHATWQAKAKLDSPDGADHLDVAHSLDFADGEAATSLQADDVHGPLLKAAARTHVALPRAALAEWPNLLRAALERETWSLSLDVPTRDLRQLPRLGLSALQDWPALKVSFNATIDHLPHAEPRVTLHLSAQQYETWQEQSACAISGLGAVLDAKSDAGQLSGRLTAVQDKRTLIDVDFSADLELAPLLLGQPAKLEHSRTRARLRDVELGSLPFVCGRARGKLQLTLDLDEPLGISPKATGSIAIQKFSLSHELVDLSGALKADAHAGTLDLRIGSAKRASLLHVAAPLQWSARSFAFDRTRELVARLDLAALPIAPFVADRAGLSYASGTLDGKVALNGSFSKPHIMGEIGLHDIAFTVTNLAQPIDHINGKIRLAGNEIVIEKLSARDRDGTLKLSATAKLDSLKEGSGKAHLVLDKFPVRDSGEIAAMVNGDLSIAAQLNADETRVQIEIARLDTFLENVGAANGLSLVPHPELRVDGVPNLAARPAVQAQQDGRAPTTHKTRIEVRSKERLWIKRGDFALRVNVALDIALQGLESRVTGKVMVERGFVDLFGQVFDVDPAGGKLEFSGSGVPDPVVSLKANHTNRRTGDVISVIISGLSSKPELKYTVNAKEVDPGVALAAIYGTTQNKQGTTTGDANSQAESMLRGLIAGVTASVARRNLGVGAPTLTLEAGDQDSRARVAAGFEFDSLVPHVLRDVITGVYFEGSVGGDSTRTDTSKGQSGGVGAGALLELHFPYNLFTSSQYGPGSRWALDFGWQLSPSR
jgi:autotransporter translocation and assembly factor TamB